MNRVKKGLYSKEDVSGLDLDSDEGKKMAACIIDQSACIQLICSHALDSVLEDNCYEELEMISEVTSRILYETYQEIRTIANCF